MLESIFGSKSAEQVLLFLENYDEGYASLIAKTFKISVSMVQKQLEKFEQAGLLVSTLKGKTRLYQFNPKYYFTNELRSLLKRSLGAMSNEERNKYYTQRTRPRRKGKPL
ncbi:MAG: winged helix-turn-helix transcriptional regulator [Oligoflexia bacterium]|nr:winged helix-turn-helix transcriptional regulator [Oligoflexia bacterium]